MFGKFSPGFSMPLTYGTSVTCTFLRDAADRQGRGKGVVQADVVAEQRVRAKADVVDAAQVRHVLEVLHVRLDGVQRVLLGQRRVRGGLDADHPALLGAGLQHVSRA